MASMWLLLVSSLVSLLVSSALSSATGSMYTGSPMKMNSTYISSTISQAGGRTSLYVDINSTAVLRNQSESSFTAVLAHNTTESQPNSRTGHQELQVDNTERNSTQSLPEMKSHMSNTSHITPSTHVLSSTLSEETVPTLLPSEPSITSISQVGQVDMQTSPEPLDVKSGDNREELQSHFALTSTSSSFTPKVEISVNEISMNTTARATSAPATQTTHQVTSTTSTTSSTPVSTPQPGSSAVPQPHITSPIAPQSTAGLAVSQSSPGSSVTPTVLSSIMRESSIPSMTAKSRTGAGGTTGHIFQKPIATTAEQSTTSAQAWPISTVETGTVCSLCMNRGVCVNSSSGEHACVCLPAWTGPDCSEDVDECVSGPCPTGSRCENTRGSFSCECPLGYNLENGRSCTRAKSFLGTFKVLKKQNSTVSSSANMHDIQRQVLQLLHASLSSLKGYSRSAVNRSRGNESHISVVNMFSMSEDVSTASVFNNIHMFLKNCSPSVEHCQLATQHTVFYRVESLCAAQQYQCDPERSQCMDSNGTAFCQCRDGYFKHSWEDLSCRECDDGFRLENGTCVQCTFGFGGFNCGNFYKLIAVVVSPAGGALLLIMLIALIVTCCRKNKNDINKMIFKSGDYQMAPYVDYPKNSRVSMEWGRENIEMQENGSTKNLLQMTDIYCSAGMRNADLERSGLCPFSGLPGSRHSCIYPAQWNPSFISDDSRRRDYF